MEAAVDLSVPHGTDILIGSASSVSEEFTALLLLASMSTFRDTINLILAIDSLSAQAFVRGLEKPRRTA
jgi:hypothetical protein